MTQVFDAETGAVDAVTVIEAGPCPVVLVRTQVADGYDAVQLAFGAVADRKLTRGELGHLEKAGAAPHRHLAEFRGESELEVGQTVTVESFEPGDEGEGGRCLDRQGLPGHDQAAQVPPRPGLARLAQRPQAGLDRCLGDTVARLQGHAHGRAHGCARASRRAGSSIHEVDAERNLLLVRGSVPGPKNALVEIRAVEA